MTTICSIPMWTDSFMRFFIVSFISRFSQPGNPHNFKTMDDVITFFGQVNLLSVINVSGSLLLEWILMERLL